MGFFVALLWALLTLAALVPGHTRHHLHTMDSVGGGPAAPAPSPSPAAALSTMDSVGGGPAV